MSKEETPDTPSVIEVSSKAEWTLDIKRDYVDARAFGAENKSYIAPARKIEGTFWGPGFSAIDFPLPFDEHPTNELVLYASHRPAFWNRFILWWKNAPWPQYPMASGLADVKMEGQLVAAAREDEPHELVMSGTFNFTGPITITAEPFTPLEARWDRLCRRIRGS